MCIDVYLSGLKEGVGAPGRLRADLGDGYDGI